MILGTDTWPTCPKCGTKMSPLKSIPPQSRCVNEKCRYIITTGKGNRVRGARRSAWLKGKTGRTTPGRPAGSGRPKVFTDPVNVTIVVERKDRDFWRHEADAFNMSLGEYIRKIVDNTLHVHF